MDVLTDVLAALELDSELYFRATLRGAFAVAVPEAPSCVRFHVVSEGRCRLAVAGAPPCNASRGDLLLVPHGAAHVLAHPDAPGDAAAARPLDALLEAAERISPTEIAHGRGDARTRLVCGHFSHRDGAHPPLFRSLPPLLHVRAGEARRWDWMDALLVHLDDEARGARSGAREVVRRLSEILLIEVLRAYLGRGESSGLIAALSDPVVRRALECIHERPGHAWTLPALAAKAGASRSVLADRFRATLGVSPMRYLAQWRIEKARHLLGRRDLSIGEIAARVGYASEAAFNRAFKGVHGAPPGRLRASLSP
ncbi:MAG: cupin domain-containing protein [Myxococcota bacterium]